MQIKRKSEVNRVCKGCVEKNTCCALPEKARRKNTWEKPKDRGCVNNTYIDGLHSEKSH